jgi:hypothetical protein
VEHKFDQPKLTVSIDNHTVLRRDLVAEKKTFGPIGRSGDRRSPDVHLTPGKHELRVRVQSPKSGYDESHTMKATFLDYGEQVLSVRFGKKQEMKISLK